MADSALFCNLETERFFLRKVGRLRAFLITAGWRRDPELMEGMFLSPQPRPLLSWWHEGPRSNGRTRFAHAIVPKSGGRPIGLHVVIRRRQDGPAHCHVGIHDRAWWGKNVVVEVRARVIGHFFAHGVRRFVARIDKRNAPSIFNYRKLGFRPTGAGTTSRIDPLTGRGRPAVELELTREHWLAGPYGEKQA